jgi:hypothetical protein
LATIMVLVLKHDSTFVLNLYESTWIKIIPCLYLQQIDLCITIYYQYVTVENFDCIIVQDN